MHIVRFVLGIEGKWGAHTRHEVQWINGEPAIVTYAGERLFCTTSVETRRRAAHRVLRVLNPEKLRHASRAHG